MAAKSRAGHGAGHKPQLTPKQRRLRQPIVPGSTVTRRALNKETRAAMRVKYGGVQHQQNQQIGEAKGYQRDIGGYYDQYLKQVGQGAANVRASGQAASQAIQGLQAGVTGLANTDLKDVNRPATADAAARGATAGDLSRMASDAAAVRQSLVGAFGAQQAAQNASAANYANTRAHVVAPGQKLQAVAGAAKNVAKLRSDRVETARERGADALLYRAGRRKDESNLVLAESVATGKAIDARANRRSERRTQRETTRHNKAGEAADRAKLRADEQQAAAKDQKAAAAPNKYGVPAGEWNAMSTAERQTIMRRFGGKDGSKGKAPSLTALQMGDALTQAQLLKAWAEKAKAGKPFVGNAKQRPLQRIPAFNKIVGRVGTDLMNPVLVTAALDAAYDKHLSRATMAKLRAAGINPRQIAGMLGVPTPKEWDRRQRQRGQIMVNQNTAAYGQAPQQPQGHY